MSERRRRRRYELDCGDGIVVQTTLRGPLDTKTADALRELGRAAVKHVEDPRCSACGHARSVHDVDGRCEVEVSDYGELDCSCPGFSIRVRERHA